MTYNRVTELTLLSWVNNTFTLDQDVESLGDLSDGIIFSKMIESINPDYAVHGLEQNFGPTKWLSNKKSLEAVYKSLLRYIGEKCPNLDSVAFESRVDLNVIAEQKDPQETIRFLTIFLMAAVEGPNNRDYINLITTRLDTPAQEEIKKVILHASSLGRQTIKHNTISTHTTNHDLALEEKLAALHVEHDNLKKKHADFMTRFERLNISHEELIQHSNDTNARLESLQGSKEGDRTDFIKKQTERIREQYDIIANQEQELESDRVIIEKQNRELTSLRPTAARLIEYQDELKEVKNENLSLVKKANKVDHYLKKLENHASLQKENSELRERIDLLDENQKDYDKVHEENARYQKTALEYGNRFQEQELHIVEISSQKNALKQEVQILNDRIFELSERQQHDEKFINELQEQIRTSTGQLCPDSPAMGNRGLSLEEELEQVEDMPKFALENSRLKEMKIIQDNLATSQVAQLKTNIAGLESDKKLLEERYQQLLEKYTTEQQQLNMLARIPPSEKDESLVNTRKLYIEASQELCSIKAKLSQLQLESVARDRELHEKNQFVSAFLSSGSLTLKDNITVMSDHVKFLEQQSLKSETSEKISSEPAIHDLDQIVKSTLEKSSDTKKTVNETMISNLIRENALIATAWYDLTNRIQSNHVVLQRRQDVPKSWLNKQRQIVNSFGKR